jgi:ABC-type polar amino acid transport system ATPase subunit
MPTRPFILEAKKIHKSFAGHAVLRGLDLKVRAGSLCVLIGRSGCGKSTLLRCLNGLEIPEQGEIQLHGKAGMVFQSFQLFPHLNTLENVMSGPRIVKKIPLAETRLLGQKLLHKVGLEGHQNHYPSQLSGGQQQRAAIARALAMNPEIMLYDEPTASLDPHLSGEVLQVMLELKKEGMTQVLVTHEHAFAAKAADQVVFIEDGLVIEAGPAKRLFKNARDPRTRRFLKGMK